MRLVWGIVALVLCATPAFAVQPGLDKCFTISFDGNSRATNALFARRHLQGGGPTWAAIMDVALKSLPKLAGVAYDLDDEADNVLVCTAADVTLALARAEYARLNKDVKALARTIDRVPKERLE